MSLLSDYETRTAWKYEPIRGSFPTAESLIRKVRPDGSFAPFPGSTVVFRAGYPCLQIIQMMQNALHHRLEDSDMLAAPLPASTIHMTLHDLISPELCHSAPGCAEMYQQETADSMTKAASLTEEIQKKFAGCEISMVSDRIVNMMSKSLVLMLRPRTEQDYELLLTLYHLFDSIQPLPYPLTPHITLAYFRPGTLHGDRLGQAVDDMQIHPENAPVFSFSPEGLTAQRFLDMQTYSDLPARICFCCDGGLNRSVLAANIVTHLARERKLPVVAQARSAFQNTQERPVSDQVWTTLQNHGITPDASYSFARYLEDKETAHFTSFALLTAGAIDRMARLHLPKEKVEDASRFFFGVRDPEYGEIPYEQAFSELYDRANQYLDAFAAAYAHDVSASAMRLPQF